MNVAVILPSPSVGVEPVRFWQQRLTSDDNLYLITLAPTRRTTISGVDVHPLAAATNGRWQSRVIRSIGRRVTRGVGLWGPYLADIWSDLFWHIRSFDPDIVDARWVARNGRLMAKLKSGKWEVIASEMDMPVFGTPTWRAYDPSSKVSIVLPVHNGRHYLRQAIDSCLNQSHENIELVIVDDCSQDESPAIIAEYASRDPRIVTIRNVRNERLPGALNVGFAATTGEFLTWTSHDNYYAPTAIEELVRYLCTWPDVDLVYSAYRVIDRSGRLRPDVNYLPPPWRLSDRNVVGAYFLYRRAVYETVGAYRQDMEYMEDYDYWVRSYKAGFNLMRLPYPLYYYRQHDDSMTARAERMAERPHTGERVRREHFQVGPRRLNTRLNVIATISNMFSGRFRIACRRP